MLLSRYERLKKTRWFFEDELKGIITCNSDLNNYEFIRGNLTRAIKELKNIYIVSYEIEELTFEGRKIMLSWQWALENKTEHETIFNDFFKLKDSEYKEWCSKYGEQRLIVEAMAIYNSEKRVSILKPKAYLKAVLNKFLGVFPSESKKIKLERLNKNLREYEYMLHLEYCQYVIDNFKELCEKLDSASFASVYSSINKAFGGTHLYSVLISNGIADPTVKANFRYIVMPKFPGVYNTIFPFTHYLELHQEKNNELTEDSLKISAQLFEVEANKRYCVKIRRV
jgi:hypothetical protein